MMCRHFRSGSEAVTYRINPFLDPAIVASARMLLRKPFLVLLELSGEFSLAGVRGPESRRRSF